MQLYEYKINNLEDNYMPNKGMKLTNFSLVELDYTRVAVQLSYIGLEPLG